MNQTNLEELSAAISLLSEKIDRLLILAEGKTITETWFNLNDLCSYLPDKPTRSTVYGWVHQNTIPYHKGKKRLRFLKSEIDSWLLEGGSKSLPQTGIEALNYVSKSSRYGK